MDAKLFSQLMGSYTKAASGVMDCMLKAPLLNFEVFDRAFKHQYLSGVSYLLTSTRQLGKTLDVWDEYQHKKKIASHRRVALVIGCTGDPGNEVCRQLAENGAKVIVAYTTAEERREVVEWQRARLREGHLVDLVHVDVGDFASCENMVKKLEGKWRRVDILVNYVAVAKRFRQNDWQSLLSTSIDRTFNVVKAVIPGMIDRHYGRVINIVYTSRAGQMFTSSERAAISGFSRSLAKEVSAYGITVNTLSRQIPEDAHDRGEIVARILDGRGKSRSKELGGAVAFLAENAKARQITGADLVVDDGLLLT